MPRPVDVLRTIRGMLSDTGLVFVGDERTEDSFTAPAPDREHYGFSIMSCLPSGMVGPNPAGTGTVMHADTVRHYATKAGFTRFDVLPIANDSWHLYLLSRGQRARGLQIVDSTNVYLSRAHARTLTNPYRFLSREKDSLEGTPSPSMR